MSPVIATAAAVITVALALYTAGVFWERRDGGLRAPHAMLFWAGLACDATGTVLMSQAAEGAASSPIHAATGALAFLLMLFHASWATIVLLRGSESSRASFHRLSVGVWLFWLVPYSYGILAGIPGVGLGSQGVAMTAAAVPLVLGSVICIRTNIRRLSR